jgi:hypothetical protein
MSRYSALRRDFAEQRRRWGTRRALHWLLMVELRRAVDLQLFVFHVRAHVMDPPFALAPVRRVKQLDAADLARACADPRLELSEAFVRTATARGHFCIGVFEGDRLLAYAWRSYGPTELGPDLWISFGPPYRYGYKALTRPEHRGEHLQDAIAFATDRMYLARGITHGLAFIETHNYPSIVADERRGNVRSGYALSLRIRGRHFVWSSPGVRRRGVRLVRERDLG